MSGKILVSRSQLRDSNQSLRFLERRHRKPARQFAVPFLGDYPLERRDLGLGAGNSTPRFEEQTDLEPRLELRTDKELLRGPAPRSYIPVRTLS